MLSNPNFKQISLVSVVGKYRTGKSYLLNNILIKKKNAFKIGNTQKACTKGIWIYSKPIEVNYQNKTMHVFFIDTEGLGAYDEEVNHDTKIFMVAILISSLFIYNSCGTIDESSINTLSFIINLSKYLKISNNVELTNNSKEYEEYFPKLLWLLRDFSLKLVDKNENPITINDYLENALNQETNLEKIKVRKSIKEFFSYRECYSLVRPVEDEKDLQNLENTQSLRKEFIDQCSLLREKVFSLLTPKSINGKILTGINLTVFLEDIVNSINNGGVPIIENSWKYMIDLENISSLKNLTSVFISKIKEYYYKELESIKGNSPNIKNGINDLNKNENEQFAKNSQIEKRSSPYLNSSSVSNKENEDSQTDSSMLNSFTNVNQRFNNFTSVNFRVILYNLIKEKNNLIESLLNNYINSESSVIIKNSEEYWTFHQKLSKCCEEEYSKFYNIEVEPTIIRIFSEKLEEISNNIMINYTTSKISNNFYKFIQDLNVLLEEVDSYPEFKSKQSIIINKIISLYKKYYEEVIVKDKNIFETEYFQLKTENTNLISKIKRMADELTSTEEFNKNKFEEMNAVIFELKAELISYKDLISLLESSRKDMAETYEKQIKDIDEAHSNKYKALSNSMNKMESELRDNELTTYNVKMQYEKQNSLNEQKINLLTNEISEIKEKSNCLIKLNNKLEDEKFEIQNQLDMSINKIKLLEEELKEEKQKRINQINQSIPISNNKGKIQNNSSNNSNINNFNKKNSLGNTSNTNTSNVVNLNIPSNSEITRIMKQNEYLKSQLENSKQVYDDIIKNLRASLQQKNHEYLKELNDKKIMESNKSLTALLSNYEDRCKKLEEKLKQYAEYKTAVKGAETFQCKECYKQYSFSVFIKHISRCKQNLVQQKQKIKSIVLEDKKINAQVTMNTNIEKTKKQEIYLEITHKKQIWSINTSLKDFVDLNTNLRIKFAHINFDYDYLEDNDIDEDLYLVGVEEKQDLTEKLNIFLKGISNNLDLNYSDDFRNFVGFELNYEKLGDSIDEENTVQFDVLEGLENTLVMTMTKNNFMTQKLSNTNINSFNFGKNKGKDQRNDNTIIDFNSTINLLHNPIKNTVKELKLENIYPVDVELNASENNSTTKKINFDKYEYNNINTSNMSKSKPITLIELDLNKDNINSNKKLQQEASVKGNKSIGDNKNNNILESDD